MEENEWIKEGMGAPLITNHSAIKEMFHFFMEEAALQFLFIHSFHQPTKKNNFSFLIDSINFMKEIDGID